MAKRKTAEGSAVDFNMTPMIDVTFQLIIFFILAGQMVNDKIKALIPPEPYESLAAEMLGDSVVIVNIVSSAGSDPTRPDSEAREAEMCYAVMAHVTDYDVWHETEDPVSVEALLAMLSTNAALAQSGLRGLVAKLAAVERDCECGSTLATALITQRDLIPEQVKRDLAPIVEKYLE